MSDGCCLWRRSKERGGRRAGIQWEIKGSVLLLAGRGMMLAAPIAVRTVPTREGRPEVDTALLADEEAPFSAKVSKVSFLPKDLEGAELSTHPSSCPRALVLLQLPKPADEDEGQAAASHSISAGRVGHLA